MLSTFQYEGSSVPTSYMFRLRSLASKSKKRPMAHYWWLREPIAYKSGAEQTSCSDEDLRFHFSVVHDGYNRLVSLIVLRRRHCLTDHFGLSAPRLSGRRGSGLRPDL